MLRFIDWLLTGIVVLFVVFLANAAAFAQDTDYGKPGHPGGSWGEQDSPPPVAEYDPGCKPKAGTPQSLLDYFAKFKQPIPQQYCIAEAPKVVPAPQAQEEQAPPPPDDRAYDHWEKGTPPEIPDANTQQEPQTGQQEPEYQEPLPAPPPVYGYAPPPPPGYYNDGRVVVGPGQIHLNFPRFHLDLFFDRGGRNGGPY